MDEENLSKSKSASDFVTDQMISPSRLLEHRSSTAPEMSDFSSSSSSSSSSDNDEDNTDDTSESEDESNDDSGKQSSPEPQQSSRSWMLDNMKIPVENKQPTTNISNQNKNDSSDSDGSESDEDAQRMTSNLNSPQKSKKEDLRLLWESNPQVYGVRRSSRSRKEPDTDDSDGGQRKRKGKGRSRKHESTDYTGTLTESESGEESTSEFDSPPGYRRNNRQRNRQTNKKRGPSRLTQMRSVLEGKKKGSSKSKRSSNQWKRNQSNLSDESSSDDEDEGRPQRSSSRNQNTKISYKEDSPDDTDSGDVMEVPDKEEELDTSECIERIMDFRIGRIGATGGKTTSYAMESSQDPNDDFDPEKEEGVAQYHISWKGWSHLHNTWESEDTVREQKVRGIKKLENYIRKKEELDAWLRVASPEDAEYYLCQQELGRELMTTYCQVERVIAKSRIKNSFGFWDYQVKWKGLPYSECTWEDEELIGRRFKDEIEKFEVRQENQKVPRRDGKGRQKSRYIPMKNVPDWLENLGGIELRDYQVDGINWLAHSWCRNNSVILADEMGLGKTIQSITFLSYLYHIHNVYGPYLIIVPLSTIAAWQKEFQTWAPFMNIIVFVGDVTSRNVIREVEWMFPNKKLKFNVVLTTYEILLKEKIFLGSHTWAVIAVDEAHRLKNEDSLLYRSLIEFKSYNRLLITGTPLQNSLKELYSLLHFIMPEKFESWTSFEEDHTHERETGYTSLHRILQPYLLRRIKKDVEKSLPAKVERILRVEMSSIQKQYYRWILTKNYRELLKGAKGRVSSFCNIVMELKKCCNHAFLTKPVEKQYSSSEEKLQALIKSSGKMILLDKLLVRLREDGHRVLIFSQMVRMLNLLQDYLVINRLPFQRLDGSIKGEVRRQSLEHFNAPGSEDFCFLLSTRAGGLGINLASADTVIIFDSDWNPQNDLQAQARAHRIGQKNQVNIYRLVCVGSIEEDIIERAKKKMVLDHLVIQRMDTSGKTVLSNSNAPSASTGNPFNKDELSAILKFGAEEIFKEVEGEEKEPECDIDEILRRAETAEQTEQGEGNELLSAFKFATFTIDEDEDVTTSVKNEEEEQSRDGLKDWDDIIPEADRRLIEEEERKKQEAELYLPPRKRRSVKMNGGGSESDQGSEESDYEASDDDTDDNRKRGKYRQAQKNEIQAFTTAEVRKFVKSFRKFGNPLERLDAIARDAELTVQSEADLKKLGEQLNDQLREMMQAHNRNLLENMGNQELSQQQRRRGPSFRIGGVSVSVKATMSCIEELLPLVEVMPKNSEERKQFRLDIPVKRMRGCDCEWTSEDDSKLLIGIYEYGMGSWEQIQSDASLELTKKILRPNGEKPQAKQLQSRVEFLMRLLRKTKELGRAPTAVGSSAASAAVNAAASRMARKVRQGKKGDTNENADEKIANDAASTKKRNRKIKSKARIDNGDDSDVDASNAVAAEKPGAKKKSRKIHKKSKPKNNEENEIGENTEIPGKHPENQKDDLKNRKIKHKPKSEGHQNSNENPKNNKKISNSEKKKKDIKTEKKANQGPVHITASSEPVPISTEDDDFSGELDPETFKDCKERMRPVKKALKLLDKPPQSTANDPKAQMEHMKSCLLKIGDCVIECLREFHEVEAIKTWRKNLWIFVSKFTEFNAKRLHKLYRRAARKRDQERAEKKPHPEHTGAGDHSNTSSHIESQNSQNSVKNKKSVTGKKRSHSLINNENNKGAGDGPSTASKRPYNPPENRQRERPSTQHPPTDRKGDMYHDRHDDRRPGQTSPGVNPRYFTPEHTRNVHHNDRRFGDEDPRYPPQGGMPHREEPRGPGWPRHGDGYRYHSRDEYSRRREYEESRTHSPGRYMYDPHHPPPPREERHRRSPPPPHYHRTYRGDMDGPNRHDWERYGHYDKYSPNSNRMNSPYSHHLPRGRSPPPLNRSHYRDPGDRPHPPPPNIHSPGSIKSPGSDIRTDSKEILHRDGGKT